MRKIVVVMIAMVAMSCGKKEPAPKDNPSTKEYGFGVTKLGDDGWLISVPDQKDGHVYLHVDRSWHCPAGKPCETPRPPHWPDDCPGCTDDGCPCSLTGCRKYCRVKEPDELKKLLPDFEKVMSTSRASQGSGAN